MKNVKTLKGNSDVLYLVDKFFFIKREKRRF